MLAIIDCYINEPVNQSINEYIGHNSISYTYHSPAKHGILSLSQLPKNPTKIIILGSASNVTKEEQWHKELLAYIIPLLKSGIPVLGICFGHQLMAKYFGSEVQNANNEEYHYKEKRIIKVISSFFKYKQKQEISLAFAHQQIVKILGPKLIELGSSSQFSNEIIRHESLPFWGTQAHPEASINFLKNESNIHNDLNTLQSSGHCFIDQFLLYS